MDLRPTENYLLSYSATRKYKAEVKGATLVPSCTFLPYAGMTTRTLHPQFSKIIFCNLKFGLGLHTTRLLCYTRISSLHVHENYQRFHRFHKLLPLRPIGLLLTEPSITSRTSIAAFESDNLSATTCSYIPSGFILNITVKSKALPEYPLFRPRAFVVPQHQLFTSSSLSYLLSSFQGSLYLLQHILYSVSTIILLSFLTRHTKILTDAGTHT